MNATTLHLLNDCRPLAYRLSQTNFQITLTLHDRQTLQAFNNLRKEVSPTELKQLARKVALSPADLGVLAIATSRVNLF
jgi:hypothetical protein